MNTFSELPLCGVLQANLARNHFITPTPVQAEAIPAALSGRDLLTTAQTGTGKTLAFLLPILERLRESSSKGVQALVLLPTRELAMQVLDVFAQLRPNTGVRAALVVGGLSEEPQLADIRRGAQLLVATPGRLEDYLRRKLIRLDGVRVLVLDEADRMLDMGFQPAIQAILAYLPESRQTMFFSATIENSVAHLVDRYLSDPVVVQIGAMNKPAPSVRLQVFEVSQDRKIDLLQELISSEPGTFLVFSRTKHGTDKLAHRLIRAGVDAARIHGDRSQAQRTAALHGFQQGKYRVLVATDVAARGIHIENIAHVVNFDLPKIPEDFVHRVGRTGRVDCTGTASTFATREQRAEVRQIERTLQIKLERRTMENGECTVAPDLPEPLPVRNSIAAGIRRRSARVPVSRRRYTAASV